jgi:hypothetical protein
MACGGGGSSSSSSSVAFGRLTITSFIASKTSLDNPEAVHFLGELDRLAVWLLVVGVVILPGSEWGIASDVNTTTSYFPVFQCAGVASGNKSHGHVKNTVRTPNNLVRMKVYL